MKDSVPWNSIRLFSNYLVGCLVCSFGWLVGWLVGWLIGCLVICLVG